MEKIINQAFTAHQEGRLKEAEQLYRSILENQPTNLDVNNNLGVILQKLGRLSGAFVSTQKAIKLRSEYFLARINLDVVSNKTVLSWHLPTIKK